MILATHAVVGAAVARLFPNHPIVAFFAAFTSHFVLDAIPHWHYHVGSFTRGEKDHLRNDDFIITKKSTGDIAKIGADFIFGIMLAGIFFNSSTPTTLWLIGALAGVFPDHLQFAYWKIRREPLTTLQRFHLWIHAETRLDDQNVIGITLQLTLILTAVFFSRLVI